MKILCTGGQGFLGKWIESEAIASNHEFVSYDMQSGKDILERDKFYFECENNQPDVVIHAAAIADLYESDKNLDKNFSVNVQGTYYIARICAILNIPLIYISTCCTYGNQSRRQMTDEYTMPIPTETYAWSKLAGEKVLGCVGPLHGCILRLGTFYGPGMRDSLFNAKVIASIIKDEIIEIHGSGGQTRRYIYVQDVTRAIIKACEKLQNIYEFEKLFPFTTDNNPLPILNVIGREEISCNYTMSVVESLLGKKAKIKYVDERLGQIKKQMIDCQRAEYILGWEEKTNYQDGMKKCIEWYRNGKQ